MLMLKAQNMAMITRLYILFVGLLMALFVGVGIAAFYHGPTAPEYPTKLERSLPTAEDSAEQLKIQAKYDQDQKDYQAKLETYQRNVSLLAMAGAIILVLLGLTVLKNVSIINDSLLLGGVFTLIYSIVRGFGSGDDAFRFTLVTASLAIAITLGYIKLIKPMQTASKKR